MNETKLLKGRIYGRFSSSPQEKGSSRERQIQETNRWAKINSIEIIGQPFFDEAVSGKDGANLSKELGRVINESNSGEYILCEEIDRLGRQNPIEVCTLIYQIVQKGINIVATKTNQIINAETIKDIATLLPLFTGATVGYVENTRKIRRLKDTNIIFVKKALNGQQSPTLIKYLPKCFKWDDSLKKLVVIEEKAKIYQDIFKLYNEGNGVTSICYILNKSKTPTFNKKRKNSQSIVKPWMESTIKKMLRNQSLCGKLIINEQIITCFPQIISQNVFDLTQYLIEKNKGRHGNNSGRTNNLFRNIGKCIYCNGTINVNISPQSKGRKVPLYAYRCKNARLKLCTQPHKQLNAKLVEPLFFDLYFNGNPESFFSDDENKLEKEKDIIIQKISKSQEAIEILIDLAENGNKKVKERLSKKEKEIQDLEIEINLINEKILNKPQSLSIFNQLSDEIDVFDIKNENVNISIDDRIKIKDFINNYHQRILDKLSNEELRKNISYTMQSLFTSVIFDCVNKTIQGIKKNGEPLALINISNKNYMFQKIKPKKQK